MTEAEAEEVSAIVRGRGYALGNELLNVINMPVAAHKNMHKITKALGAEADLNRGRYVGKIDPVLQDLIDSGDVPSTRYRADMITRYLDKFAPVLREAQDEVLTIDATAPERARELLGAYIGELLTRMG